MGPVIIAAPASACWECSAGPARLPDAAAHVPAFPTVSGHRTRPFEGVRTHHWLQPICSTCCCTQALLVQVRSYLEDGLASGSDMSQDPSRHMIAGCAYGTLRHPAKQHSPLQAAWAAGRRLQYWRPGTPAAVPPSAGGAAHVTRTLWPQRAAPARQPGLQLGQWSGATIALLALLCLAHWA